jgi:hypothetical protein
LQERSKYGDVATNNGADEMQRGLMNWGSEAEPKELTCLLKIVLRLDLLSLLSAEPCVLDRMLDPLVPRESARHYISRGYANELKSTKQNHSQCEFNLRLNN